MNPTCVVSDAYKFICILIAKNATSTLRRAFEHPCYQSYECSYDELTPETRDTYFTFALLRDPVPRFLSAYQEISMRKDGQPLSDQDRPFFSMDDTWERFQAFLTEAKQHKWDEHIVDQQAYIGDKRIDFLGTLETFDGSLRYVFDRLNIADYQPLPIRRSRQDRKTRYHYSQFYIDAVDQATEEAIRDLYKTDVAWFTQVRDAQRSQADARDTLNAYLLHGYQTQNAQHQRYFVHHLGNRGGFIAELTLVARAMVYALGHNLQLVLDSSEFTYTFERGWTDYFEPFCEAYAPAMAPRVERYMRCFNAQKNRPAEELEHFNELKTFRPDRLRLGNLEIHGLDEMMKLFLMTIFRLNRQTQNAVDGLRRTLSLPDSYVAVHIRRGDKVGDEDVYYPCEHYMEKVLPLASYTAIFVMSDDHQAVQEVQAYLAQRHLKNPVYSLCTEDHVGFDMRKVLDRAYFFGRDASQAEDDQTYRTYIYNETVRLLAELSIASKSQKFVSTFRSNVGKTVRYLHPYPERCVLMQATPELKQLMATMQQASGKRQPLRIVGPHAARPASQRPDSTAMRPCDHPMRHLKQTPVIIGGCGRSGTTLLLSLLSAHPHIYVMSHHGQDLKTNTFSQQIHHDMRPLTMLYEKYLHHLPDRYTRWCEKSPTNVRFMQEILDFFGDDVRFLHMVRDGRDVVTSIHPNRTGQYSVTPKRWVNDVSAGLPFDHHPQVMVISYERLVTDHERVMKRVCAFIGEPFHPALLDYPDSASIQISGAWFQKAHPVHAESIGRWRRPEHLQQVSKLIETPGAVELLGYYGYL